MTGRFCQSCGRTREYGASVCTGCGHAHTDPAQQPFGPSAWPAAPGAESYVGPGPYSPTPPHAGGQYPPADPFPPPYGYPAPGGYPAQYGPVGGYPPPVRTSTRAVWILVLGISSLLVPVVTCFFGAPLGPIAAIVALCLAPGARREIQQSGGSISGRGLVTGGVVTSWITIVLTIIGVIVFILLIAGGAFETSTY